ncbi:non-ribosomal peptide synthetase [Sphaerisporangium aureirubrum]|uniref:Amino acid adenylation domain-containing protein n=1 Tax=Sphaerisporangium aureirubrum TaxID=1544736 RepID=A0ABW1NUU6_9ACTN
MLIPPDLARALHTLASSAGAGDFVPLSICAAVLARRLSRPGAARRVQVVQGALEAVAPDPDAPVDLAGSFRTALRRAARGRGAAPPDAATRRGIDVTIVVAKDNRCLYGESMTSAADAPTAECWARSFLRLLTRMVSDPDAPMAAHPLVDGTERDRILRGLNAYGTPEVRHTTMTAPFEEQVELTPDAVALVDLVEGGGTTLTYRELNERANRLAHFLIGQGAGPGRRVGICMRRGVHQVVAVYAAVKTGAAYVPLEAELPDSRLAYMLQDVAPGQVLTDPDCRGRVPDGAWRTVDVESGQRSWEAFPAGDPAVDGGGLLNILYTSGTTGRPKGVAYPTAGALAHLSWMQSRYPFGPGDHALFKTSPGFDVSIWELFWPLYHGACLVICPPGEHRDPRRLAGLVEDHRVSTIFLPPTVMAPFLEKVSADRAGALRWAMCGGEPVTPRVRDMFYATLPTARLVNCYGPTEAGNVTDMVLPDEPGVPVVPLGRPAANFRITLLDENLDLMPVGMPGEAYIGGDVGLAHAYWRAPGRTAERFVADPYGPPGSRVYRTGDLCRYRDDGVLEHLGRIDRQIKIRGLRVEPGEIESVLAAHPSVADCAVVAHGEPVRLLAFVVPAGPVGVDDLDVDAIGEHAAGILADHMRPERIVPVPRIPATVNGKVDKDALLAARRAPAGGEREIVPPADDVEAALVGIYGRVLATWPVSVLDTFAELGGHSLLAFELLDACLARLHVRPGVSDLLGGSVRDVAASIRAARSGTAGPGGGASDG